MYKEVLNHTCTLSLFRELHADYNLWLNFDLIPTRWSEGHLEFCNIDAIAAGIRK